MSTPPRLRVARLSRHDFRTVFLPAVMPPAITRIQRSRAWLRAAWYTAGVLTAPAGYSATVTSYADGSCWAVRRRNGRVQVVETTPAVRMVRVAR